MLKGRQQVFHGTGRFDLLFVDRHQTNILMELKAVPARYEDASQLAKYYEALKARGERRIVMWLVAPNVSLAVREFLDHVGIEYSEIHESEFRRVAERHDCPILSVAADMASVAAAPSSGAREPSLKCLNYSDLKVGETYLSIFPRYPGIVPGKFPFEVLAIGEDKKVRVIFRFPVRTCGGKEYVLPDEIADLSQDANGQWLHYGTKVADAPLQVATLGGRAREKHQRDMKYRQEFLNSRN